MTQQDLSLWLEAIMLSAHRQQHQSQGKTYAAPGDCIGANHPLGSVGWRDKGTVIQNPLKCD